MSASHDVETHLFCLLCNFVFLFFKLCYWLRWICHSPFYIWTSVCD